ncbi:MAG TPA: GGDEF domain-containing protein [Spirochaetota bacterium]|nr:GGDEF domain-containing protein [Spirochaetota bacterium]
MKKDSKTRLKTKGDTTNHGSKDSCLVVIKGKNEAQKFVLEQNGCPLSNSFNLGRSMEVNDFVLRDSLVSRQHLKIFYKEGTFFIEDQKSSNGTYLNDHLLANAHALKNNDLIKTGSTVLKFLSGDLENIFLDRMRDKINLDPMTGAYTRHFFMSYMEQQFKSAVRYDNPFTLLMYDLDCFKKINDTYGHQAGDIVLTETAQAVQKRLRSSDLFARIGGEEFTVLLPDTNQKNGRQLAQTLRKNIADCEFNFKNKKIHVTASIGIMTYHSRFKTVQDMIKACDDQLYKAKHKGRNRVAG